MKKQFLLFFAILCFTISYGQGFVVNNYKVDIYINAEGYFDVVESYDIDFKMLKHGIYRDIQTRYDMINFEGEPEKREIKISKIDVPDRTFEATDFFSRRVGGNLRIKIGDADKTVSGLQHYEIKYRVANAFLHEPDADRFYWNLKPTYWFAPFLGMQFQIHLPEGISLDAQDYRVYSGLEGTQLAQEDFTITQANGVITGTTAKGFNSVYGEAVTVLIDLPKGAVKEYKPIWPFWDRYGWALLSGMLIFGFYLLWRRYGKDDPAPTTISYHPPANMDPAMAGFLINDKDNTTDLISLIPYWGSQGYLKLQEVEGKGLFVKDDTKLTKLKNIPSDSPKYQHTIFKGLFGGSGKTVLVSSLRNSFYTKMTAAKAELTKDAQRYYVPESNAVMKITYGVLIILMILLAPVALFFWGFIGIFSVILTSIVLMIVNRYMIKKNPPGTRIFAELKGFKQFIKTAEENKLKMLLKDDPSYFESTMGYALSFGAFSIWAKKFAALNVNPPEWYSSSTGSHFSMNNFSSSFNSAMSSAGSTMVSSPSSSGSGGGGSSGGGFGGGGGGSW
jgi:uncharacterized membrane protein YgcG